MNDLGSRKLRKKMKENGIAGLKLLYKRGRGRV